MDAVKISDKDYTTKLNGEETELTALIEEWLSFVRHRRSKNTHIIYKVAMNEFIRCLPSRACPNKITPLHIERLITHLLDTNRSPATANLYLAAVKSFYRWANNYHDVKNITHSIARLETSPSKIRILSDTEYAAVIRNSHGQDRDALQFLANTGLRRNEFKALLWRDFVDGFIRVTGKGNKFRLVPLNSVCKRIIGHTRFGSAPPFITALKSYHPIYKLCARAAKKANIDYFTPHSLRHYFATRLIRAGVSLMIVSKLLGHASTQITEQVYVHFITQDLRVTDILDS